MNEKTRIRKSFSDLVQENKQALLKIQSARQMRKNGSVIRK